MNLEVAICSPVVREALHDSLLALEGIEPSLIAPGDLPDAALAADVLVLSGTNYSRELAQALESADRRCRWLLLLSAGYELLEQYGVSPSVRVANAGSVWSPVVAEHTMALLLALARRLPAAFAAQTRSRWDDTIRREMGALTASTLVIVGMGSIGGEVARRARAFGMTIIGVSRSGRSHADADRMYPVSELREALAQADFVVVALPLSSGTKGIIGAGELAACASHVSLVNVGRGPVVDSVALEQALKAGVILGAGLDVTDPEPLPADSALWQLPNVIITPHLGGAAPAQYYRRLTEHVTRNVSAIAAGTQIRDLVDTSGFAHPRSQGESR